MRFGIFYYTECDVIKEILPEDVTKEEAVREAGKRFNEMTEDEKNLTNHYEVAQVEVNENGFIQYNRGYKCVIDFASSSFYLRTDCVNSDGKKIWQLEDKKMDRVVAHGNIISHNEVIKELGLSDKDMKIEFYRQFIKEYIFTCIDKDIKNTLGYLPNYKI